MRFCRRWRRRFKRPAEPYTVRFATVLAIIDPASMEITHLEICTPRHVIQPGYFYQSAVVGQRVITVDYKPVALNGETF